MNDTNQPWYAGRMFECRTCGHVYGGPHFPSYRVVTLHSVVSHSGAPAILGEVVA
jgi:hypothetical protein